MRIKSKINVPKVRNAAANIGSSPTLDTSKVPVVGIDVHHPHSQLRSRLRFESELLSRRLCPPAVMNALLDFEMSVPEKTFATKSRSMPLDGRSILGLGTGFQRILLRR
jgi:hypothetical protein